jgi:hypothetical protein
VVCCQGTCAQLSKDRRCGLQHVASSTEESEKNDAKQGWWATCSSHRSRSPVQGQATSEPAAVPKLNPCTHTHSRSCHHISLYFTASAVCTRAAKPVSKRRVDSSSTDLVGESTAVEGRERLDSGCISCDLLSCLALSTAGYEQRFNCSGSKSRSAWSRRTRALSSRREWSVPRHGAGPPAALRLTSGSCQSSQSVGIL